MIDAHLRSALTFRHISTVAEHDRVELVEAALHHLHADPDVALAEKRPVEVHGERAVAGSHADVEIHEQSGLE